MTLARTRDERLDAAKVLEPLRWRPGQVPAHEVQVLRAMRQIGKILSPVFCRHGLSLAPEASISYLLDTGKRRGPT